MSDLLSFVLAAAIALLLGQPVIASLRQLKFGQSVREDGPKAHLAKTGTPTMGGVLFLVGGLAVALAMDGHSPSVLLFAMSVVAFGAVGFADDFVKIRLRRPLGLRGRDKVAIGILLALALAIGAQAWVHIGTGIVVPGLGLARVLTLPMWAYDVLVVFVVVGATNAVNITDGLDGLAGGLSAMVLAFFAAVASDVQQPLAIAALALSGGVVGFLFYNLHPAKVFMGDTGSLALGGAIAALAVLTRTELFLPLVGLVFVLETVSVIVQVISFRVFGRRVLRMSPLHHHFELSGWPETRVVGRFWAIGLVVAMIGYALWYAGGVW